MYKELRYDEVIHTISKLEERIKERFPDSGIGEVCEELGRRPNSDIDPITA